LVTFGRVKVSFKGPTFFSQLDEDIFFRYLKSISYIGEARGRLDRLYFELNLSDARKDEFQKLLGCLNRFGIEKERWILKLEKGAKSMRNIRIAKRRADNRASNGTGTQMSRLAKRL
jgi:hypothetical protein